MKKAKIIALLYAVILTVFTAYVLLDTFVIVRVYSDVVDEPSFTDEGSTGQGGTQASADPSVSEEHWLPIVTDNSYIDEDICIVLTEYREYDTTVYVADVRISSMDYFKAAFANDQFGRNITETTSSMAARKGAVLAINGDFYGAQPRSYVLRNGVLYRDLSKRDQEDLVVYSDGSFDTFIEREVEIEDYLANGAIHVFAFGPTLVSDGKVTVTSDQEVGLSMASNPRTAIAIIDELHYLFVVSDGRTAESEGLSLYQLARFLQDRGASIAYNLDGGGSATMYFNGEVINTPTTNGQFKEERSVSDIVYIGH